MQKNKNSQSRPPLFRPSRLSHALLLSLAPLSAPWAAETDTANADRKDVDAVIEVTAQKRTERIQDVPITMNAYGTETLRNLGALNIKDIGDITPGMDASNLSVTQPRFSIRGIGTTDFGIGSDPAVAVYIDGVYVGRSGSAQINFNDVERVEVLKGPQGTLFGRNAGAGAIHIITKKPVNETGGDIRLTVGEYSRRQIEGSLNLSNGDNVHARLSFLDNERDGYVERTDGGDDLGAEDNHGARLALLWNAGADTDVTFRAEMEKTDQDAVIGASANCAISLCDPFGAVASDIDDEETRDLEGYGVEIEHRMGDMTFTSITAQRGFESNNFEEEDGSNAPRFNISTNNVEELDSFSQELRLTGFGDTTKWSLGSIYVTEDAKQTHNVIANTSSLDTFFLVNAGIPGEMIPDVPPGFGLGGFFYQAFQPVLIDNGLPNGWEDLAGMLGLPDGTAAAAAYANMNLNQFWQEQMHDKGDYRSLAFYGDITWSATERLDLTVGLRYTRDEKTFTVNSAYQNALDLSGGMLNAGTILPCASDAGGACIDPGTGQYIFIVGANTPLGEIVPFPVPFGLVFAEEVPNIKNTEEWDAWTPRFVVDYEWTSSVMTFFSVANGFKAGGFNSLGADVANNRLESFDPEDIWNYELGLKSTLLDGALIFNASVFHYTYDDLQLLKLTGPAGVIPTYNIGNADAEGDGFEMEFSWRLADSFRLHGNVSQLDTEYTDYDYNQFPGEGPEDDITGEELSNMPDKWNLGFDYSINLGGGSIVWYLNNSHVSEQVSRNGLYTVKIGGYDLLNTRLSYQPGSGDWEVALNATNLLDEEYLISLGGEGEALGSPLTRRGKPRMTNLTFSYFF